MAGVWFEKPDFSVSKILELSLFINKVSLLSIDLYRPLATSIEPQRSAKISAKPPPKIKKVP
jgi:hypothetical protein